MQRIFAGLIIILFLPVVGCAAPITANDSSVTVANLDKPTAAVVAVAESDEPVGEDADEPQVENEPPVGEEASDVVELALADSQTAVTTTVTSATTITSQTPAVSQTISRADLLVSLVEVEEPLRAPVAIVPIPDGSNRNLLVDRVGLVYFFNPSGRIPTEPFMDMRPLLARNPAGVDGYGLQGLAFDPDFEENGRFYILYSQPQANGNGYDGYLAALNTRPLNRDAANLDTEDILAQFELDQPQGQLARENNSLRVVWADNEQCFDLVRAVAQSCGEPVNALPALPTALSSGDSRPTLLPGYRYQGVAFPTFLDQYIFAGQEGAYGRLFIASPPAAVTQPPRVQYLHIMNGENGRFPATFHTLSRDAFGELYLLTAPEEGVNGRIYKLQPHIRLERSLIDDEPEDYLPIQVNYARIVRATPIYPSLDAVRAGQANGTHGGGSYWVTIRGQEEVNGKTYYYIHWGWGTYAWVSGDDLSMGALYSSLKGFDLNQYDSGYPVVMAHRPVFVRSRPGPIIDETVVGYLDPYDVVNVYDTFVYINEDGDEEIWYLIGVDQWVHSEYVRMFVTSPRPAGVGPNDKWVEIRLPEQTVIAYEGDRPVLATLSSTGRRGFETETGLFQVWATLREGPMEWDNSVPPYSLANIPYIMYFNGDQALHNAYWHDQFGIVRSAGCVNLSPHDAHWLFHWAFPDRPNLRIYNVTEEDPILWVWVHDQPLDMDQQLALYNFSQIEWPKSAVPR
jgi:hypothetical protein